jgi:hypothetical protein
MLSRTDLPSLPKFVVRASRRIAPRALAALSLLAAPAALGGGDVLLIPDTNSDKVWAVSPFDGSVIDSNFIPADGIMKQVIQIVVSPTNTLLMIDEQMNSVFEYSPRGVYLRTLASPADGVIGAYGGCIRDGFLYFTSGAGDLTPNGRIYKVALSGGPVTVFSDWTGIGQPRGIVVSGDGFLVGNSTEDDIEIVSATGEVAKIPFHDSNGGTGINFPQQMTFLANGYLLVTGFSSPWGLYFFDPKGQQVARFGGEVVTTSPRGAYELDSGDFLFTGGTRIDRITLSGVASSIVNQLGTSFRWITRFTPPPPLCAADIDGNGAVDAGDLAALLAAWGSAGGAADIDGSGAVDAADLGALLAAWGPCAS